MHVPYEWHPLSLLCLSRVAVFYTMQLVIALYVLSSVLTAIAAAEGIDRAKVAAGYDVVATLHENKVALLWLAVIAVVAYNYPPAPIHGHATPAEEEEQDDDEEGKGDEGEEDHVQPVVSVESEATADMYAAQRNHVGAADCYTIAANHYQSLAEDWLKVRDILSVARLFRKSADMHKAAGEHARARLAGILSPIMAAGNGEPVSFVWLAADYVDMGNRNDQGTMRGHAALQYRILADGCMTAGKSWRGLAMNQAAAEQNEAGAQCAVACYEHESAASRYFRAAREYRAVDNLDKAHAMEVAGAEQNEAHGMTLLDQGDHGGAALYFRTAANAYEATGHAEKGRVAMGAAAEHFETGGIQAEARGDKGHAAMYYSDAAKAYEKIGQSDKARSLWQMAAVGYEALAIEQKEQGDNGGAVTFYSNAIEAYDKVGDDEKAQLMTEAAYALD